MLLEVRFFGDFSVLLDGQPIERLTSGKVAGLFQYLLLNRAHTVRRETLHGVLWPDREWSPTDSSLKVAVHSLRRTLREATGNPELVEIIGQGPGYRLRTEDIWLDLDDFQQCITAGQSAENNGDHQRAVHCYRRAVDLYRGDFLALETVDWATTPRECDRAHVLYALSFLRADALRRDRYSEVLSLCRRIIEVDPCHEEVYQTLILVHGRRGELGQVRNWHHMCVTRLRDHLDVPPTDTTRRIFARAVRGELRTWSMSA